MEEKLRKLQTNRRHKSELFYKQLKFFAIILFKSEVRCNSCGC